MVAGLRELLLASYSCIFVRTHDYEGAEKAVIEAITEIDTVREHPKGQDVTDFCIWSQTQKLRIWRTSDRTGRDFIPENKSFVQALDLITNPENKRSTIILFHNVRSIVQGSQPVNVQAVIDAALEGRQKYSAVIFVGPHMDIPPELENIVYIYDLPLPNKEQLIDLCLDKLLMPNLDIFKFLELPPAKLTPDLEESLNDCRRRMLFDLNKTLLENVATAASGLDPITAENTFALSIAMHQKLDIKTIHEEKKQAIRKTDVLEVWSTEETMSDVGGFGRFKKWLHRRSRAFTEEAKEFGVAAPRGVLLVGIPGTGKSLAAKAVASELNLPLLRFDMANVYGRYVGDSESKMRQALNILESVAPAVAWIDELEKAVAGAKDVGDSGVSNRVIGQFLQFQQERRGDIFLCCTCNDIKAIPTEMYRPGRIDAVFAVLLPLLQEREEIFAIHLRKRNRNPDDFDLKVLALASEGYTGAEIELAINEALFMAFASSKHEEVTTALIKKAIKSIKPDSERNSAKLREIERFASEMAIPVADAPEAEDSKKVRRLTPLKS